MDFNQQGIEPESFPLLLQSLKTDSPVKDMHSNPNKKLYGGKALVLVPDMSYRTVTCTFFSRKLIRLLSFVAEHIVDLLPVLRSHGAFAGC